MIKAVIFDLDDTLVESREVKWAQHKHVGKNFYNIDITDEELSKGWGLPFAKFIEFLYKDIDTVENISARHVEVHDMFPKKNYPETETTLNTLGEEYILGVVSSSRRDFVQKAIKDGNFPADKFKVIQGADDSEFHKPDPRVFDSTIVRLKEFDVMPEETLYVGDSLTDYLAARDAGMHFVAVTTGLATEEAFKQAGVRYIIKSIGQLKDLVKKF